MTRTFARSACRASAIRSQTVRVSRRHQNAPPRSVADCADPEPCRVSAATLACASDHARALAKSRARSTAASDPELRSCAAGTGLPPSPGHGGMRAGLIRIAENEQGGSPGRHEGFRRRAPMPFGRAATPPAVERNSTPRCIPASNRTCRGQETGAHAYSATTPCWHHHATGLDATELDAKRLAAATARQFSSAGLTAPLESSGRIHWVRRTWCSRDGASSPLA